MLQASREDDIDPDSMTYEVCKTKQNIFSLLAIMILLLFNKLCAYLGITKTRGRSGY
jgi:hypothetical protein